MTSNPLGFCVKHWDLPLSLFPPRALRSYTGHLTSCCRALGVARPRVRTWQRCAWLAGIRPCSTTSLLHIHGNLDEDCRLPALAEFCSRMFASQSPRQLWSRQLSLYSLQRSFRLTTWNVTSLRSQRDGTGKVLRIRRFSDFGIVALQETHLLANDPLPLAQSLPHSDLHYSTARRTDKGGTSGGLLFVVPGHLGYKVEGSVHEVLPGYLAWLVVMYSGLRFRCWNVHAVPHRKKQVIEALRAECQRLTEDAGEQDVLDVFAGDLNISPRREADAELFDLASRGLRMRCAQFASLAGGLSEGTYRDANGPHWIDHAGGTTASESSVMLVWHLTRDQPATASGHHVPLVLTGSLRHRRAEPKSPWPALPTWLFVGRTSSTEDLVRRLSRNLTDSGLPLDVLRAQRHAFTQTGGRDGQQSLLDEAQRLADASSLRSSPLVHFNRMEQCVHAWAKRELRSVRKSPWQVVKEAVDIASGRQVQVPADAWRAVHSILDLQPAGVLKGDVYVLGRSEAQIVVEAYSALCPNAGDFQSNPDAPDAAQYRRYRRLLPKVQPFDERLESPEGLTDDVQELDRIYAQSRDFWSCRPEVDAIGQLQHLMHYVEHVVQDSSLDVAVPTVAELHHIVVNTPDSSPGYGGVPFAAWRLVSLGVAMLLRCFFRALLEDSAAALDESPLRHQLIRWISKKIAAPQPSARRPLGISASFYRLVNAALHRIFMQHVRPRMHPAQALFREKGEALSAAEHLQSFLDTGDAAPYPLPSPPTAEARRSAVKIVGPWLQEPTRQDDDVDSLRLVSLSDFNKAFERVSPSWIMVLLCAWGVPLWLSALAAFFLYDRIVHLSVRGWVGPGRRVFSGVDIGGNASSGLYCLGLDPLLWLLALLPDLQQIEAYMDDLAAGGGLCGTAWFQAALLSFTNVMPLVVDYHSCWHVSDGDEWRGCGTPFWNLKADSAHLRSVRAPNGDSCQGRWRDLQLLCDSKQPACQCNCKLQIVPHRRPTEAEALGLFCLPWGVACVAEQAEYLGVIIGACCLWTLPQPPSIAVHRAQLSFAKPLRRIAGKVELLSSVPLSVAQRCVTWVVYILPLISYVAQYCWLCSTVEAQLVQHLSQHMRCSWWLSTSFLQCLRVWSGQSIGPQSVSAVCAGHYVGRWRRAQGALWWHTLHLSSAGRPACDAVLACLRWAEDDRCSRMTARVLLAVSDSAPVDQSGKVAGAVRAALDEMHAAQHERSFLLKFNRWPASMQAPLTCQTYRHPKHTFTQIFTMFRWLTNAVPTGRRRRHWMCRPLQPLHCECCGAKSNVVPLSRLGEMGVCHDHLAELASDHFDGSSWRAYVHLVGRVAPNLVETVGPDSLSHPVLDACDDGRSMSDREPTVASTCAACGLSDDSLEHRFFACPVFGSAWEVAFGHAQVAWTGCMSQAATLLAFFHAAHLWFAARSHVDENSVAATSATWHRNSVSLLQLWWDGLAAGDKPWELARRLSGHGVRLSGPRLAARSADVNGHLCELDLRMLSTVSRLGAAVVRALRSKETGVLPPCRQCVDCWCRMSTHPVIPVAVGPGVHAEAGRSDYRGRRWGVANRVPGAERIYTWLYHSAGGVYRSSERPALLPRIVRLGCDYTVQIIDEECMCGWRRSCVLSARELAAGTELVTLHQATWRPMESRLIITGDGGGKFVNDQPCFGAGLVAFIYSGGLAQRLAELVLPLYGAESAQEAEAAVGWEAVLWRTRVLRLALARGFEPSPPDILYGDSANTAGALEGRVRLRAPAPNRWAAGMRETTSTHTRSWHMVAIPRSMNKAADRVATTAWQLVRDVRAAMPRLTVLGSETQLQGSREGLALSSTYNWVQVLFVFDSRRSDAAGIEGAPWRLRLAEHFAMPMYQRAPSLSSNAALPQLEWTIARPEWTHRALYYALVFMPSHGNRTGQRFYRSWKLQQTYDLASQVEGGGWVFTWYATADGTGQGRAIERSPGVQFLPRPLRALLLASRHTEYDLTACHLAAIASVLGVGEAPVLHHVLAQLKSENRESFLSDLPGGKLSLVAPLNCTDLLDPSGPMQRWMRAQGAVYFVSGLKGFAEPFNGDYDYESRTRYRHALGGVIELTEGHWTLVLEGAGVCFRSGVAGPTAPPLGRWEVVDAAAGNLCLERRRRAIAEWYTEYVKELHHVLPVAISRLQQKGYTGLAGQTTRNLVYHHTAQVEAQVVRLVLMDLRGRRPLFSHALVHDALFIDTSVQCHEVLSAFDRVIAVLGLAPMQVTEKSWTKDLRAAEANLASSGYTEDAPLPVESDDAYNEASTLHRYAPLHLFDTAHRLPRR